MKKWFFLFYALIHLNLRAQVSHEKQCAIEDYGAKGDGVTNDLPAFKVALGDKACGIIKLQPKTYFLDNSFDSSLANILFIKDKQLTGTNNTVIKFTYNGLPLFLFLNSEEGGLKNVQFVFCGNTQIKDDYTLKKIKDKIGVSNIDAGGNYDLRAVIYTLNADNLAFKNLSFVSNTINDTTRGISLCINLKGAINRRSNNFLVDSISFKDCIHGMLVDNLSNFTITNISSERRFGNYHMAPGHVIYLSGFGGNKNGTIANIRDYGKPMNLEGRCLATFALRNMDSITISNVYSAHPEGLVQSFQKITNCTFSNFTWIKKDAYHSTGSFINFVGPGDIKNNRFDNFYVEADSEFARISSVSGLVTNMSDNSFSDFYIKTCIQKSVLEKNKLAVFDINGTNNTFTNIYIEPHALNSNGKNMATNEYNKLYCWRTQSFNNKADIHIVGDYGRSIENFIVQKSDEKNPSNIMHARGKPNLTVFY